MTDRQSLLDAREALHIALLTAEAWHKSYKTNKESFALLLSLEARLETSVAEYLHELADRAPTYVDWTVLKASGVANANDPAWEAEQQLLTVAVLQILTDVTALGVAAGEDIYGIPLAFDSLDDAIMQSARKQTAALVKGVTDTTRKLIREAVAQSIALGENSMLATQRIVEIIDNPIRAKLIAQTEPVNAYQSGLSRYAKATGAIQKTWDGLPGACKICTPVIGKTIGIDQSFVLGNGAELQHPAGHPRCRCGLVYVY